MKCQVIPSILVMDGRLRCEFESHESKYLYYTLYGSEYVKFESHKPTNRTLKQRNEERGGKKYTENSYLHFA